MIASMLVYLATAQLTFVTAKKKFKPRSGFNGFTSAKNNTLV